MHTESWLSAH